MSAMTITPLRCIGENSPRLSAEHVHFTNLNLDTLAFKQFLTPIIEIICNRLESTYKSPSKLEYLGAYNLLNNKLSTNMQFDDVAVKLWHLESGQFIYIVLGARLARTLLIRLLATSLIDDASPLLFSATEKGIFSFIVARLIFDLKNSLKELMPNFKIIGIYHYQDEAVQEGDLKQAGIYNFSLAFAADFYPVSIVIPKNLIKTVNIPQHGLDHLFARCGHIKRPCAVPIKVISLKPHAFKSLDFGDLILFDHTDLSYEQKALSGPIQADFFKKISLDGELLAKDGNYLFRFSRHAIRRSKENTMEHLEISHETDDNTSDPDNELSARGLNDLAKSIRIPLSIEIARLPMSLKEICLLREGEIINLHRKIDEPLELVLDNKVIGYCQPVQIDGRLGIRILKIESTSKAETA